MSRSSLTFFLLVLSFGILFAGCGAPEPDASFEEFTFTDEELAAIHAVTQGDDASVPTMDTEDGEPAVLSVDSPGVIAGSTDTTLPVVDEAKKSLYASLRQSVEEQPDGVYVVNNPYLNVRLTAVVTSEQVGSLNNGDLVTIVEQPNAEWAKVKMPSGREGYVAFRYLARVTTEEKLPAEKKKFEGRYFVDYGFVNMRQEPSTQAAKLAEVPGKTIVKPTSIGNGWARIVHDGKDGYVSTEYLTPFAPAFLVRQDSYQLPILHYNADDVASIGALPKHMEALKASGKRIVTMKNLYDTVLAQQSRDVRVSPGTVALAITGVNAGNVRAVQTALDSARVPASLFVQTKDLGLTGITEKTVLTLMANGHEIQSGGHTGDDLRTMTDSQVRLELGQSKKLIEDMTKREVYAVAYPRGGVNDRTLAEAGERAYLFGISQSPDKRFTRSQFLRLPTLYVNSGMTEEDVKRLVEVQ